MLPDLSGYKKHSLHDFPTSNIVPGLSAIEEQQYCSDINYFTLAFARILLQSLQ